jgi:hypothetical protein
MGMGWQISDEGLTFAWPWKTYLFPFPPSALPNLLIIHVAQNAKIQPPVCAPAEKFSMYEMLLSDFPFFMIFIIIIRDDAKGMRACRHFQDYKTKRETL